MHAFTMVAVASILSACELERPDHNRALEAVRTYGFSNPVITRSGLGGRNEGCDRKDGEFFDVTATNVAGARVSVVVCCGHYSNKGCTLRTR